jgi:heme/copper-type cytochrome/quinol oxidase subunit 3
MVLAQRGDPGNMSVDEDVLALAQEPGADLPHHTSGPQSFAWWGMVLLIATEATLFAALIATYFYLRFKSGPAWPPDHIEKPTLELPLIMSVILLSSSIPVHIADAGIKNGNVKRLKVGLAIGFLLGAIFLFLTWGVEWPEKLHEFKPSTNSYGSLFFTITGFHSMHVLVGLIMSAWSQVRAWQGAFDADRHITVQLFGMYWHFVDVVWVVVLGSLYISPNL